MGDTRVSQNNRDFEHSFGPKPLGDTIVFSKTINREILGHWVTQVLVTLEFSMIIYYSLALAAHSWFKAHANGGITLRGIPFNKNLSGAKISTQRPKFSSGEFCLFSGSSGVAL